METREKQAYLIEAHKCDEMLLTLLRMLDVPWNDIFIHMDSKNTDYQPETVECRMKYAKVFHAKRHSVVWGGVSQVKAELVLLKTAVAHGPYQHYHLISGVDLPIQTQEDIRAFFEANPDVEFVHFDPHPFSPFNDERVYYRHFFQNIDLRRHPVLGVINGILLSGQKLLKIKRNQDVHFTKGSNWFSCTDGFARYLLTKEEWARIPSVASPVEAPVKIPIWNGLPLACSSSAIFAISGVTALGVPAGVKPLSPML